MNDFDELGDNLSTEIDKRKLEGLVDSGVVSDDDLANATIDLECPNCNLVQDIDNDECEACGFDIL